MSVITRTRAKIFNGVADFLDANIPPEKFDMDFYRKAYGVKGRPIYLLSPCHFYSPNDCGTVGCALGYFPLSAVPGTEPIASDFCKTLPDILSWKYYRRRVVGEQDEIWDFVFNSHWQFVDNTPTGAAARLRLVADWEGTMNEFIAGPLALRNRIEILRSDEALPAWRNVMREYDDLIAPFKREAA